MEARYETLRSQINPHFLFNSLNSLTAMVDGNPKAIEYLGNLTELLRYMLKSHEKELVLVSEELDVLKNYIHLQKLRFGDNLLIDLDVPESALQYALPPLALQMLVENAIKHNIITHENPLKISIAADTEAITVENNLQRKENDRLSGQGLNNIMGRYRLFTTRSVKVEETLDSFKVALPILKFEL
jgi:LytS/YehU family sensor histidine kinase